MFECYNDCNKRGFTKVGLALYEQSTMFADMSKLIDPECQIRIREYQFCKEFNCPPYPSLQETPADIVDEFMVIHEEMLQYRLKGD
tara:strand:+ start:16798 stop:17055 length:258 start_codon:yes stop_codon:yes gene_type:complete